MSTVRPAASTSSADPLPRAFIISRGAAFIIVALILGLHTTTTIYTVVVAALILIALAQPIVSRHDRRLAHAQAAASRNS